MNICLAINRCFVRILRCSSKCCGEEDSLLNERGVLRVLNVVCGIVAVAETTWITGYLFIVLLPWHYETSQSIPSTLFRVLWGLLLAYSVPYHYLKTRHAKPIKLPENASNIHCAKCASPKPRDTSHCSTCATCIYKMDHHCPWVGQCVGAHNQANFFLFIWSVFQATVLVLYVHWQFWMDSVRLWMEGPFPQCLMKGAGMSGLFSLLIVSTLHFIILSFLLTYVYLVSDGLTYMMKMFKREDASQKRKKTWSMLRARWRQYLALKYGQSIIGALFIPSDRTVDDFEFFQ